MFLKQSTAAQTRLTPRFVDDTDFKTPETGLTIANTDVKLSKNGGASANKNSGGGTHIEAGRYALTFDATDTATVGELAVGIVMSGALPVEFKFFVLEEVVYDAWYAVSAVGYITDQPVNATKFGGTTVTGRDLGASVLLSAGTGTGQLDFTSGIPKVNLVQILGTLLTETSGQIAAAFKKWFDVAAPVGTVNSIPNATAGAAGGILIAGTNAPVTITGSGNALTLTSTGSNGHGLVSTGNGSGEGISAQGGATGNGIEATGGATSGDGVKATGGTDGQAMNLLGNGTGSGLYIQSGSGASGNAVNMIAQSTNGAGLNVAGRGSGQGLKAVGGATAPGVEANGGSTSGAGMRIAAAAGNSIGLEAQGSGTASGLQASGGATGAGLKAVGGATSGSGAEFTTTSGDGIKSAPTAGDGMNLVANGTSKHGLRATGGGAGTSDGASLIAGTGGVDLRANQTGNVTGNLSGSAGSVTGAVGSVTGNVGGNVTGSVGSVVAGVTVTTNSDKTGYALTSGERDAIATAALKLDWTGITGEASRSMLNALRFLRNKWSIAAGTLTVRKEDDSASAWTGAVTTTAGNPVSEIDPT